MLEWPLFNLLITGALAVVTILLLARWLPKTPLFRAILLERANPSGPSFETASPVLTHLAVGAEGVALSILRPSGKAKLGGEIVDVITDGEFVAAESPVRVVQIAGSRIIVKPIG
jgi:membrane-bound serine protease (ClpP class)